MNVSLAAASLAVSSIAVLAPSAGANDLRATFEGVVTEEIGAGLASGPLAGASVGDSFRLEVDLVTPASGFGANVRIYNIDTAQTEIKVGLRSVADGINPEGFPSFVFGDDVAFPSFPRVDYALGIFSLSSGLRVDVLIEDADGLVFDSPQIEQLVGPRLVPDASFATLRQALSEDGIRVELERFSLNSTAPVGVPYCGPAVPNSTGNPAGIAAFGSAAAADNDLVIQASGLPPGQFGLLLASRVPGSITTVPNSSGTLCLGGSIGRYVSLIAASGASGVANYNLDLGAVPQPTQFVPVVPGDVWNFQVWYRDLAPGPVQTSNFSNAIAVTFI